MPLKHLTWYLKHNRNKHMWVLFCLLNLFKGSIVSLPNILLNEALQGHFHLQRSWSSEATPPRPRLSCAHSRTLPGRPAPSVIWSRPVLPSEPLLQHLLYPEEVLAYLRQMKSMQAPGPTQVQPSLMKPSLIPQEPALPPLSPQHLTAFIVTVFCY